MRDHVTYLVVVSGALLIAHGLVTGLFKSPLQGISEVLLGLALSAIVLRGNL